MPLKLLEPVNAPKLLKRTYLESECSVEKQHRPRTSATSVTRHTEDLIPKDSVECYFFPPEKGRTSKSLSITGDVLGFIFHCLQ